MSDKQRRYRGSLATVADGIRVVICLRLGRLVADAESSSDDFWSSRSTSILTLHGVRRLPTHRTDVNPRYWFCRSVDISVEETGPHNPTPEKLAPYECGIVPLQDPVIRFPVKFYLVAMLFVIFDVEIVFLFLWAVRMDQFGWVGIGAVVLFMLMLIETLGYVWKRGALDWNVARRARNRRVVAPVATLDEAA